MIEPDFSKESEDEFYEDFSGWQITDEELDEMLRHARSTSDVKLRRIVKQNLYFRWLLRNIVELSDTNGDIRNVLELVNAALRNTRIRQS